MALEVSRSIREGGTIFPERDPDIPPAGGRPRVAVVGAGVFGLMSAWRLAQAGASVTVYDRDPEGLNASRVAAGMIAPAAECALEEGLWQIAPALRAARVAWAHITRELRVDLSQHGTRWGAPADKLREREALLSHLGFRTQRLRAAPGDPPEARPLWLPEDAVIDPGAALDALRSAILREGGAIRRGDVLPAGERLSVDGAPLAADVVVLAAGASPKLAALAPELSRLRPIKGQLLRWPNPLSRSDTTLRLGNSFYMTVQPHEIVAGATLEFDRDDLAPEPELLARYADEACFWVPALREIEPQHQVGVRVATPDGLPLAGPSARAGVILATGARRNGWLFAPMVAGIVTAQALGRPLGPLASLAERLDPRRFEGDPA